MKYFWIYCAVVLMALVVALEVRSTLEAQYQLNLDEMVKQANHR